MPIKNETKCPVCGHEMILKSRKYFSGMYEYWWECPNEHDNTEQQLVNNDEPQKEGRSE